MKTRNCIMLTALAMLIMSSAGIAQPPDTLSGPLSGTLGPGSYVVVGDCWVESYNTLTIQPGTSFLFAGHYNLVIETNGELQAVGTELDSIVFTRQYPDTSCDWGGIRFVYGASSSSILSYCVLEYAHPAPNVNGGALYIQSQGITITHCTIANNSAKCGGGIYLNASSVTISDCVFANNSASQSGGGLHLKWSSNAMLSNCVFCNNASHGALTSFGGGGIRCEDLLGSPSTFTNNLLINNTAVYNGGGFMNSGTAAYGAIPTLINNTIVQNSCTSTSSSAMGGGLMVATAEDTVIGLNNIVYDNYATNDPNISGTALFTYSCVEGGLSGTGNIDEDPLFVTGPGGDCYLSQTAAGQPTTSPCVDAGDPASAMITGTTRTDGIQDAGIVDMGYHYAVMEGPPPPDLSVTLTPHDPPIQIPAGGGSFMFDVAIENTTAEAIVADVWIDVVPPGGTALSLVVRTDVSFPASTTITRPDMTQNVPPRAPAGTYTYTCSVGEMMGTVIDFDQFTFEKLETGEGLSTVNDWNLSGWEDEVVQASAPAEFSLHSVYPNPFNPLTTISYALPEAARVTLRIFDVNGRQISELANGWRDAGVHEVTFDATNLASGVYVYRLDAGAFTASGKMVLMK